MHIAYRRGLRHPLTQAASGLAILGGDSPRPGERSEVTRARHVGYAITRNELFAGATGVAVPIMGSDGRAVASISVVWLGDQIDEAHAATELKRVADKIMATLDEEAGSGLAQAISMR
jgi:DNA-binding IclR family transcriptional regulator